MAYVDEDLHPSVQTLVPPPAAPPARTPTSAMPLEQRPQVVDGVSPMRTDIQPVAPRKVALGPIGTIAQPTAGQQAVAAAHLIGDGSPSPQSLIGPGAKPPSGVITGLAKAYNGSETQAVIDGGHQAQLDAADRGDYSGMMGHIARTGLAVPVAAGMDAANVVGRAGGTVLGPIANGLRTFFTGTSGADAPAAPAAAPGPIAARATAQAPAGKPYEPFESGYPTATPDAAAAAPTAQATGIPGVQKTVEGGRTTYSDGASSPLPSGPISARNMQAATALDAKYRAEAAPAPEQGSVVILPSSGSAQGATGIERTPSIDTTGLSKREIARLATQTANNRENNTTSRENNQLSNATSVRGQDVSARTTERGQTIQALSQRERNAIDAATASSNIAHTGVQTQTLLRQDKAQAAYADAVASGNTQKIARAEEVLRASQGKYEKPDQYSVTGIPGGIDPATGQSRGTGAIIVNRATGDTQIISPEDARGGNKPKFEAGKVYKDGAGNLAKWDGTKFVPAQ